MKRLIRLSCVSVAITAAVVMNVDKIKAGDNPKTVSKKPKIPDRVYVKITTNMGDIVLELNQEKAPITVKNFLEYTDSGYYNNTIFHRVINGFMIQGGGFATDKKKKTTRGGIKNEWKNGLKNKLGTISMARLGGNPDSGTSQFFINVKDNSFLDQPQRDGAAYAVFGKVICGMDVVNKIKLVKTRNQGGAFANAPVEPVIMKEVKRINSDSAKDLIAAAKAADAKAEAAKADPWKTAMDFVKQHNGDPAKGQKSSSGLWHVDLAVGSGPSPIPTDNVKVHYTGWFVDGKKFDSSVDRGQPATFPLNGVIKGWTEGVGGMKIGGKSFFVIPPDLAYGPSGRSGIPANSTLIFEVELLAINP